MASTVSRRPLPSAMRAAAAESLAWYNSAYDADNKQALAEAQKLGMQVNDVEDLDQFRKAVQPVYQKYADRVGGMAMIQAVIDTKYTRSCAAYSGDHRCSEHGGDLLLLS